MRRFFFLFFSLLALAALGWDLWRGPFQGQPVDFTSTAEYWAGFHRSSLIGLNAFIEKRISPDLWDILFLPALAAPAFVGAAVPALFFFMIRPKRRKPRRSGSMFPRKRR